MLREDLDLTQAGVLEVLGEDRQGPPPRLLLGLSRGVVVHRRELLDQLRHELLGGRRRQAASRATQERDEQDHQGTQQQGVRVGDCSARAPVGPRVGP